VVSEVFGIDCSAVKVHAGDTQAHTRRPSRRRSWLLMSMDTAMVDAANCEDTPAPAVAGSSRIGLIVPSSNTTMETELPELFRRQTEATGHRYTFHSARAEMKQVNREELLAMVGKAADCATAVSDADVDVIAYACLVAVPAPTRSPSRSSPRRRGPTAIPPRWSAAPVRWCGACRRSAPSGSPS
jgi:maleate isomerase